MRIISQNEKLDLPYENIVVEIMNSVIVAYTPMTNPLRMAQYKSQEKAEKAMQKLRECYLGIHVVEKLNDTVDCSSLSQIGIYKKNENGDYAYKLPAGEKIFRFPQDDEL